MDLKPYTGTSAVPSSEEPNDRLGATSPPRKMAIAMMEQRCHGGPGDRGGMGVPAGHRFCADWRGLLLEAYSWRLAGVKRNPT